MAMIISSLASLSKDWIGGTKQRKYTFGWSDWIELGIMVGGEMLSNFGMDINLFDFFLKLTTIESLLSSTLGVSEK